MPAAILAMKMMVAFRPQYLAITGITAGLSERVRIGDVIVADPSWDWGSGKWITKDNDLDFLASPHQLPLSPAIRNKLTLMSNDVALLAQIRHKWPGEKPDHELSIKIGPLASGASVLADGTTAERIRHQHRNLLGIEMETYGVFSAADEAINPKPLALSIKSVVDFAGGEKNDQYQPYAAFTSTMILTHFMEHYS